MYTTHSGPNLKILRLGGEAEAIHTARQLALAKDLLGILKGCI